jgi:hypothetical protein
MVATPSYTGTVAMECAVSMAGATALCLLHGVILEWIFRTNMALIQSARNWLTADFLNNPRFTHLMWLDDDMGFEPDAIMKLLACDLDVVGAACPLKERQRPQSPCFVGIPSGPPDGNLQPMSRRGGAFILVKRHVIEAVAKRCPSYWQLHGPIDIPDGQQLPVRTQRTLVPHLFETPLIDDRLNPGQTVMLPEDYLFCHRLTEAGFKLYARSDLSISHFGRHEWKGRLADHLQQVAAPGKVTDCAQILQSL